MSSFPVILSMIETVMVFVPSLFMVALVTVAESKTMASMQSSVGPNAVGYYGLLQAFADALKLLLKEYMAPTQANMVLFFLAPVITLMFSLMAYVVMPYGPGLAMNDFNLGVFYLLAVSSLATYGILLAGWSANSKYAFLGSLRSTAQLISYELVLSSCMLIVIFLMGSLNLTAITEAQSAVWYMMPLFPAFVIFFIGSMAETNRAPFDLAEAESELVSGFMTEHSSVIFVFFFLAEYASVVLMCMLTNVFFVGSYLLFTCSHLISLINFFCFHIYFLQDWAENFFYYKESIYNSSIVEGLLNSLSFGFKSSVTICMFIWVSASFPSVSFDQLMSFCWTVLLPMLFATIILVPCLMYNFNIFPVMTDLV